MAWVLLLPHRGTMLRLGADSAYGRVPDMANQLRIESANGAPIADCRVFEGYVEVRALSFSRPHLLETSGRWKRPNRNFRSCEAVSCLGLLVAIQIRGE